MSAVIVPVRYVPNPAPISEWTGKPFTIDLNEYPILVYRGDGTLIDAAGNRESAESVLYGDLSDHDGQPRIVQVPQEMTDLIEYLQWAAETNADCFGIPEDVIQPVLGWS